MAVPTAADIADVVRSGNLDVLQGLLEEGDGIDKGHACKMAVWTRQVSVLQLLLDKGASIHSTDDAENSLLHHAADVGDVEVVRVLLDCKACPLAVNQNYRLPSDKARDQPVIDLLRAAEAAALQERNDDCLRGTNISDDDLSDCLDTNMTNVSSHAFGGHSQCGAEAAKCVPVPREPDVPPRQQTLFVPSGHKRVQGSAPPKRRELASKPVEKATPAEGAATTSSSAPPLTKCTQMENALEAASAADTEKNSRSVDAAKVQLTPHEANASAVANVLGIDPGSDSESAPRPPPSKPPGADDAIEPTTAGVAVAKELDAAAHPPAGVVTADTSKAASDELAGSVLDGPAQEAAQPMSSFEMAPPVMNQRPPTGGVVVRTTAAPRAHQPQRLPATQRPPRMAATTTGMPSAQRSAMKPAPMLSGVVAAPAVTAPKPVIVAGRRTHFPAQAPAAAPPMRDLLVQTTSSIQAVPHVDYVEDVTAPAAAFGANAAPGGGSGGVAGLVLTATGIAPALVATEDDGSGEVDQPDLAGGATEDSRGEARDSGAGLTVAPPVAGSPRRDGTFGWNQSVAVQHWVAATSAGSTSADSMPSAWQDANRNGDKPRDSSKAAQPEGESLKRQPAPDPAGTKTPLTPGRSAGARELVSETPKKSQNRKKTRAKAKKKAIDARGYSTSSDKKKDSPEHVCLSNGTVAAAPSDIGAHAKAAPKDVAVLVKAPEFSLFFEDEEPDWEALATASSDAEDLFDQDFTMAQPLSI